MNPRDVNAGPAAPSYPSGYAPYDDPNAALWASITPPSDPTLSTKVRRRVGAFSPDVLAHRLRLALPGIFPSHNIAFYAVLAGAMTLGATVGLLGFAAADALNSESSVVAAASAAETRAEPGATSRVHRETPSLRPAVVDTSLRSSTAHAASAPQTLTTVTPPAAIDDVDSPPPPRAKRQHTTSRITKKKAKRAHLSKKRSGSRRDARPRTRNEKARALARNDRAAALRQSRPHRPARTTLAGLIVRQSASEPSQEAAPEYRNRALAHARARAAFAPKPRRSMRDQKHSPAPAPDSRARSHGASAPRHPP